MSRRLREVLAVVLAVLAVAVMVRLSVWQWDRARSSGSWLNYTYAGEWLLFALLTVAGVVRLGLEGRRAGRADPPPAPVVPRDVVPQVGPPLAPGEELPEVTWLRLRRRLGLG